MIAVAIIIACLVVVARSKRSISRVGGRLGGLTPSNDSNVEWQRHLVTLQEPIVYEGSVVFEVLKCLFLYFLGLITQLVDFQ